MRQRARRSHARGMTDDRWLEAAYACHKRRLIARAIRVVVDPDLAEDAVQEAFIRAWRARATFDPSVGPIENWLLAITGNVAVDLARARARRPSVSATEPDSNRPAPNLDPIDRIVLRAELRHALREISADHRMAVVEVIVKDRPYAEVAAELGVNVGTLRTRVHYGLRQLRLLMPGKPRVTPPVSCAAAG
jgi:RNA polymerase sigma-70 factor (ECF subfamily)